MGAPRRSRRGERPRRRLARSLRLGLRRSLRLGRLLGARRALLALVALSARALTAGSGDLTASLDTSSKAFTYKVTYKGLSGPATAAHFHGPAAPGANAPPVVMVANPASPISGSATLTDPQVADLKAGKWYFNVHTAANGGGEIRGQVTAAK